MVAVGGQGLQDGGGAGFEPTGDAMVDEILGRLERLGPDVAPAEQAVVLEEVHDRLQSRLGTADR